MSQISTVFCLPLFTLLAAGWVVRLFTSKYIVLYNVKECDSRITAGLAFYLQPWIAKGLKVNKFRPVSLTYK